MSNDFEKASILAKLASEFEVTPEVHRSLLDQIESSEIKDNYNRIQRGLHFEITYQNLFETLPWVKNLHELGQKQYSRHKVDYQVPDFSAMIEDSGKDRFPILIEVKSVKRSKENFEIIVKQKHTLLNYARDEKKVILLAIYWEKYDYWTHTVLSALTGKKKNKLTFQDATKNDISHIISDYMFLCTKKFYRKTIFCSKGEAHNQSDLVHKRHGILKSIEISLDDKNYINLDAIYSAVIDSVFTMKEIDYNSKNNTLIEVFEGNIFIKLSTWILRHLTLFNLDGNTLSDFKDENGEKMNFYMVARYVIMDFIHRLGIENSYLIPDIKDKNTDKIFELAYKDTSVLERYKLSKCN